MFLRLHIIFAFLSCSLVMPERSSNTNAHLDRQQPRRTNKAVRNVLFASKLWLTPDQVKVLNQLQMKGDFDGVVQELTSFYRNLRDKTRASLRVQSTCRAILSDEVNKSEIDELVTMKARLVPSSELVAKVNSLFRSLKDTDAAAIQPLCAVAFEDSKVPSASAPR